MTGGKYWTRMVSFTMGCSPSSLACSTCWASNLVLRMKHNPKLGYLDPDAPAIVDENGKWTGKVQVCFPTVNRARLSVRGRSHVIAVNWLGDLFYSGVPDEVIFDALDALAANAIRRYEAASPPHVYLLLTHRPHRMVSVAITWFHRRGWLRHGAVPSNAIPTPVLRTFWWGATVTRSDGLDDALEITSLPGHHWLSIEPLDHWRNTALAAHGIDWVACGLNTLRGSTAEDFAALERLCEDCHVAGVPFWVKQDGPRWQRSRIDQLVGITRYNAPVRMMPDDIMRAFRGE